MMKYLTENTSAALMGTLVLSAILSFSFHQKPALAFTEDKDWPCIQRKVDALSAGQMWRGNPVDPSDKSWQENKDVIKLANSIIVRRVPLEETDKIITEFTEKNSKDTNKLLEQTFLALLDETNKVRKEIINGIGKFSKRQKAFSKRIIENQRKIAEFEKKDADGTLTKEEDRELVKLEQQLEWDTRIHEEREKSLEYVCESPVLLEQRLFALSQQLKKHYK